MRADQKPPGGLDELGQLDPRTAGECVVLLANKTSKARSTRSGQSRPRLSAGEIGLAARMTKGDKRVQASHEQNKDEA